MSHNNNKISCPLCLKVINNRIASCEDWEVKKKKYWEGQLLADCNNGKGCNLYCNERNLGDWTENMGCPKCIAENRTEKGWVSYKVNGDLNKGDYKPCEKCGYASLEQPAVNEPTPNQDVPTNNPTETPTDVPPTPTPNDLPNNNQTPPINNNEPNKPKKEDKGKADKKPKPLSNSLKSLLKSYFLDNNIKNIKMVNNELEIEYNDNSSPQLTVEQKQEIKQSLWTSNHSTAIKSRFRYWN